MVLYHNVIILIVIMLPIILSTTDMDAGDFNYLANKMTSDECRKLIASLQTSTYDFPEALSDIEIEVPQNESCIDLLLEWDMGPQGREQTSIFVAHRLRQIDRSDLRSWLTTNTFNKLSQKLQNDWKETSSSHSSPINETMKNELDTLANKLNKKEWSTLDTVLVVLILLILTLLIITFWNFLYELCGKLFRRSSTEKDEEEVMLRPSR